MAIRVITGDQAANKKHIISQELIRLKANIKDAKIFYLVPEHLKFDMETLMLEEIQKATGSNQAAMFDIQVVSFTRLAWFLLDDTLKETISISKMGLGMLCRQALLENEEDLYVFRAQINHQGFIEKLVDLFEELYQANILPSDLVDEEIDTNTKLDELVIDDKQRLKEIALLYDSYLYKLKNHKLSKYHVTDLFIHWLNEVELDSPHYLVIDHHYYFTAQQTELVMALAKVFKEVYITLPIEEENLLTDSYSPLYSLQQKTFKQLQTLASEKGIEFGKVWQIDGPKYNYDKGIITLANAYKNETNYQNSPIENNIKFENVEVWQCDRVQTSLEHISNQIHYLVNQKGYRYKDILVVARDLDYYQPIIEPYFSQNDIPYFYDHEVSMASHSFVGWLESLLNLKRKNFQYEDLMNFLKNEYYLIEPVRKLLKEGEQPEVLDTYREDLMTFENIIIANGYFGYRFSSKSYEWNFEEMNSSYRTDLTYGELANYLRREILDSLLDSFSIWDNKLTGKAAVNWLYELLLSLGVDDRLINLRDQAISNGDLELSRQHEQVWNTLIMLLDEFYELYKEELVDFDLFCDLLLTGIKEASFHIIPPTLDQVTVTNMLSPQVKPYKICFALDCDDQNLPIKQNFTSLLVRTDRQKINQKLKETNRLAYLNEVEEENYQLETILGYELLLKATDKLYLTYAANSDEGTREFTSYYKPLLEKDTYQVPIYRFEQAGSLTHTSCLGSVETAYSKVLKDFRDSYQKQSILNDSTIELLEAVILEASSGQKLNLARLLNGAFEFDILPTNIQEDTAVKLFGKELNLSVSKVEQYYQDPYSHFLLYGLRLKERKTFEVNVGTVGDYFHEYLDILTNELMDRNIRLDQLTSDDYKKLLEETIDKLSEKYKYNIFDTNPRLKAIKYRLNQSMSLFLKHSRKQQELTNFRPIQAEGVFGKGKDNLEGFEYALNNGGKLIITGKIDRIDVHEDLPYLQVIDYKSGNKDFSLQGAYYGLDLQILTYLSVALQNYPDYKPAGAFYQPLLHSLQQADRVYNKESEVEELQLSKNRLNGFVTIPSSKLEEIEEGLKTNPQSLVYPVRLKKDGDYNALSKAYNQDELYVMLSYVHHMFKEAGENIQAGNISLQPFKDESFTPTLQPEYQVITGFDPTEHYDIYREKTVSNKDAIEAMVNVLEGGSQDNE